MPAPTWIDISVQSLLDAAPDAMIVVNKTGRIVIANKQAEKMFRYTREQLHEKPLEELVPPRFRAQYRQHRDKFFASPQARTRGLGLDLFALCRDSTEIPVDISLSPLVTGGDSFVIAAIRDATEQRRTRELRKSEAILRGGVEGFRLIANIAPAPIWVSGPDKECTYFNDRWLEFTGRPMAAELGNGWAEGVHADDLKICMDTYIRAFDRREQFRMEYRLRRHDGEYRWVFDVGVPRFDQDGSFAGYIGIAVDTTERRRAEEALQKSEERFRLAAQAGRMFAYEWDAVTDQIVLSGVVSEILGDDAGAHATLEHILTMIPAEDRGRVIAVIAQLTPEKPSLRIRHRIVRSDGTLIWVERKGRAYFDEHGKMLRTVGMLVDITDRVRAEEALHQKQSELSEAQRLAGVGSWHWDARNDIVTWSEELYRIAGCDPRRPAPNYKEHPRHYTAESWERLQRVVEEALRDGTCYELDLELVRPDGTTRWVRAHGEAVADTAGRIVGLRGTAQDITERKLAEEALAGVSRKLLGAQEQERARIARELHDDISQRLALLSGEIQRMKEAPPASTETLRSRMDELEQHASEIATGVQSLSHELHSSRLEYLGVVSAIRGFCKEFGDKHKVKVTFDNEGIPPTVPQDISLCLFRIVQEGLRNAVKHSGVRFFEVKIKGSPAEIHLTVRDSGVGFEPELATEIQGLGLISMKERVRLVNGTISITSRPQSGTEISVHVPLSAGKPGEQTQAAGA